MMSGPIEAAKRKALFAAHHGARLMLTLLAVAAGCVDAASFLGLGQVMTAAMTGNTVLLGLALGQADAEGSLRATVALAAFVAGALVGAAIVERGPGGVVWAPAVTAALALELVVLVALALAWHVLEGGPAWPIDYRHPLIAAAGVAMGIQSAAAQRVGVPGVTTTYVTGTLTSHGRASGRLAAVISRRARRSGRCRRGSLAPGERVDRLRRRSRVRRGGAPLVAQGRASARPCRRAGEIRWSSGGLLLPIAIVAAVILIAALAYRRRDTQA